MAWYDSFGIEFLRDLGIEWWFHRKGRGAPTGGTTGGTTPATPKSLLEWVENLPPVYRRGLKELPTEELGKLLSLDKDKREAELVARFGLPPTLLESLREAVGDFEEKIETSPETKARLDSWADWLRRIK